MVQRLVREQRLGRGGGGLQLMAPCGGCGAGAATAETRLLRRLALCAGQPAARGAVVKGVRVVVGKVKIGPHIARGCSWSVHFRFCCCFWPLFFKTVDLGIVMPARPLGRRGRTGESQAKMAMATRRTPSDPRARCTTEHRPAARAPTLDRNINITSFAVPFSRCFAQTGGGGGKKVN